MLRYPQRMGAIAENSLSVTRVPGPSRVAAIRAIVWAMLVCFWLLSLGLLARRFSGGLEQPLSNVGLFAAGTILASAAFVLRAARQKFGRYDVRSLAIDLAMSAAVAMVAVALSLPGSPTFGLLALWTIVVVEEFATMLLLPSNRKAPSERSGLLGNLDVLPPVAVAWQPAAELGDIDFRQQFQRVRDIDGRDRLTGRMRIDLAAGQRTGHLHAAFCPPFEELPVVEAKTLDGPAARVKTAQILPHGIRLDIRLDRPADEASCLYVEFTAIGHSAES